MSSNRRKQQQPRHIIQDPFLLTETLQNAVSFDYVTPEVERSCDNHTCGKCCAEFYTMPEFLLHKKHCTNEWPISFASDDSAEKVTVSSNTVHPYNATEIQMALASLQRQQIVQLQMIQQIYSQLLDDKTDVDDEGANGNDGDAVDVETEKSSPSKEPETKNDATDLGCDKCRLCGKVEPNLEKMQNHLRIEHSRELNLPYVCDKCSLRFVSREELKDHVTDCHWKKMLENDDAIDVDETYDDDDDDDNAGARPKSYPAAVSRLLTIQFKQDSDDAKSDPGTYRCPGSSDCSPNGDSEMSPISSSGDSLYTGNNEDSLNENYPTPVRGNVNGESAPLDLSRASATSATGALPSSLKTEHFSGETKDDRCVRDETPRSLFSPITPALRTRAPTMQTPIVRQRIRSRSPANRPDSNGDGGASTNNKNINNNEDDWESLMEIQNTDDTAKIRQMVGDKDTKLTDPNQCIVCHRILSCKSALQMHYRTHTGTRPFKCRVCQRAFTTKGNLKTHMGVHRTKPPFRLFHQCPVCHKRFTNGLVLQQHIRLHVGQPTEISMDQINAGELRDSESRSISPPNIQHQPQTTSLSSTRTTAVVVAGSSSSEVPHSNHPSLTSNGIPLSVPSMKFFSTFGGSTAFTPIDVVNNSANNNVFRNNDVDNRRKSVDGGELSQSINSADRQHRRAFSFSPATNCPFPSTANVEPASPVGFQQMQSPLPMTASSNPYTAVMGPTPQQMAMMSGRPSTTCNICFKTFACYSALEIHYRSHTKERPFKCDVCNRGFSTKGNMKQHLLTHKIRDTPSSSITMTTTSAKNGTVWHSGHSNGNGCNGDRTPTSFTGNNANDDSGRESSQSQTSQHSQSMPTIKSEFAANAPALENASETTAAKSSFGVDAHHHHRRPTATIYVPEPGEILSPDDDVELDGGSMVNSPSMTPGANGPTPLESIQKMWAKAETLAATSSSHDSTISPTAKRPVSGLNKHQCQLCYKNFSSASALQIHMRTHTGDRPFSCKVCGRAFTTKGNLKVHMGTHMWTNANRRGRRIFDAQGSTTTNSSKSVNNGDVDYSDDDSCSSNNVPSKDVARHTTNNETPVAKNGDNDADGVKTKNYGNPYSTGENDTTKSSVKFHHPHLPPTSFSVGNPNSVLLSQHAGFGFPHPDILSSNFLVANPFVSSTTTMASSFSPYSAAAAAAQFGHHFSSPAQTPVNGRPPSDGSLEAAMLLMWRTVCSVCHKVCASVDELEDHLKHHLGQVGLDRKTPLQT